VAVGVIWFMKRYDELPAIVSVFLFYIFSIRYWALAAGWTTSVNITNFGFNQMTDQEAAKSLFLGTLGQSIFLIAYMSTQGKRLAVKTHTLSKSTGFALRRITFVLAILVVPAAVVVRSFVGEQKEAGVSMAFGLSSYIILFPFAVSGAAILMLAALKLGAFTTPKMKILSILTLVLISYVSFGSGARFQFIGWLIAGIIIFSSDIAPKKRIPLYLIGFLFVAGVFSVAGALRDIAHGEAVTAEIQDKAWKRILSATDANMLDGMALVQQVYPEMLDYGYGKEHLEILARPIPRYLWPDKPVGGYMNKLKIFDKTSSGTLGISPSLFGSFYGEGGIVAVVILSYIYGSVIAWTMMLTKRIHPLSSALLRGCVCAGIIPILRGGDLPGIYAWIGMAFWPAGVALFYCRKALAKDTHRSRLKSKILSRKSRYKIHGLARSKKNQSAIIE
jgi:oligosaccharide repeat unit polymerase